MKYNFDKLVDRSICLDNEALVISDDRLKLGLKFLNVFGILACEAAYKHGEQWLEELIEYLHENKEFVKNFLEEKIPKIKMNSAQLKEFMLTKPKVAFDEGDIFGNEGEGFERINIACSRFLLKEALVRVEEVINRENV